ncbi:twin-arginine translocation signal domain-containing protein [Streptomyces sp. RB110-1]|uniref:polysaccharide lyase 8 family protein n=1 Tax=unclassified Streptomyces TaxID=2593676 RepID=UPI001901BCE9|nr:MULTISPECIES: polysaccharide lyase 8 family protein [unclassified Streptomyces]MBK0372762.1 twin-arginine translocation signal domain-containing protein [Streptomyces sp. RB110-1]MBK0390870.1 twin-arginine translocation signal domain-containing protein [Streptomyces sp. RB110-2]
MTTAWSRRTFLATSAVLTAAVGAALTPPASAAPLSPSPAADPYAALRATWSRLILGEGFSPTAEPFRSRLTDLGAKARGLLETMAPADGSLWPDAVFADPDPDTDAESFAFSGRMADSFARLNTMAQAYRQQGTGLTGSTALRDAVLTGLEHLNTQVYNDRQTRYGNWYSWQIGAPQALLDVCVLLYDAIAPERLARYCAAVDHFVPDSAVASYTGTSTGANRVDLCRVLALRGAVGASAAKIALARDALSPVFPLVSKGDGLYADGSFIQHTTVPYTGSYGSVMLGGLGMLFALLKGSDWEVTDPKKQVVFDAVENAWAPFLFNGLVMDAVAGRAISRGEADDHRRGHPILASIVLLGQGASAVENTRWRSLVKGWAQRDYYSPPLSNPSLGLTALSRIKNVLDDTALTPLPEPDGHRLFPDMARATHRRPGWAASLSMADRRVTYYETGNGENLRGWHTGSGMLYWWGDTFANGQYSDAFWPTVDPYRLPGTTASRKALANGAGGDWGASLPDVNWVGGATDGKRAAVGQYLRGLSSTLMAKKSWFFLDDTVVCLGAGIQCRDGATVETTVDNRNLGPTGSAPFTVDGSAKPLTPPWSATLTGASWAHLGGHGGYVFPGGATVKALRENRTGRWRDINTGGSADQLSRKYLTLWFDHGKDPSDASYAYQLLPGATEQRTAARAADSGWLRILANSDDQQGVAVPSLGLTAVNFWFGGTVGPLVADAPCSVMVTEHGDGTATVCVSDPMRKRTSLTLTWNRTVASVVSKPATVTSATTGTSLRLVFGDLSATRGATQTVKVRLA